MAPMTLKIINNANVLAADTIAFTEGGAEAMRIDSSGNVGIKTTTPATELDISTGAITGGVKRYITLTSLNLSSAEIGYADIGVTFNQLTAGIESGGMNFRCMNDGTIRDRYLFGGGAGDVHAWFTGADTERMRIDTSGSVFIGTTSALQSTEKLAILDSAGNACLLAKQTSGAGGWVHKVWNSATSGNNQFIEFLTETSITARGSIDYNRAGNAVRYNTTSDQRIKKNIVDAPSAIDLINSVKIRSFDWKETGFHVDYGVIAQELNEVAPDAVSIGEDDEDGTIKRLWGVDTSVLVPALVKTVQEQQAIIEQLKATTTSQQTKIDALEARITSLENK
jgi:hypothetical protein